MPSLESCFEGGTCRQSSSQRRLGGGKKGRWVRYCLYQIHKEWRTCKCLTCFTKGCQKGKVATQSIGSCTFGVEVGIFMYFWCLSIYKRRWVEGTLEALKVVVETCWDWAKQKSTPCVGCYPSRISFLFNQLYTPTLKGITSRLCRHINGNNGYPSTYLLKCYAVLQVAGRWVEGLRRSCPSCEALLWRSNPCHQKQLLFLGPE